MNKTHKIDLTKPSIETRFVRDHFIQRPEAIARTLLGRTIVREYSEGRPTLARIKEVAAWRGQEDSSDDTINNGYGIIGISRKFGQDIIDIGTGAKEQPSCVSLIALESPDGIIQGPGNVSKYLGVDRVFDGFPIDEDNLWIGGNPISPRKILERRKSNVPDNCLGYFYYRV